MKKLLLLLVLMLAFVATVLAQTYRTNDQKADRLGMTLAEVSNAVYSYALSEKAEEAIMEWYNESYKKGLFEYTDSEAAYAFCNILTFNKTRDSYDILKTIKNTTAISPDKSSWTDAMEVDGRIGCGYVEIYDTAEEKYFGVWLVIYEESI